MQTFRKPYCIALHQAAAHRFTVITRPPCAVGTQQ